MKLIGTGGEREGQAENEGLVGRREGRAEYEGTVREKEKLR